MQVGALVMFRIHGFGVQTDLQGNLIGPWLARGDTRVCRKCPVGAKAVAAGLGPYFLGPLFPKFAAVPEDAKAEGSFRAGGLQPQLCILRYPCIGRLLTLCWLQGKSASFPLSSAPFLCSAHQSEAHRTQ